MPLVQFFRGQPSAAGKWSHLGDLYAVASDVVGLPRLNSVHDSSGVVAELALGDHLHSMSVAR
jgi:hypothetical protein